MELLELLAAKMGCEYLSDLRFLPNPTEILQSAAELPEAPFSLREWLDAEEYLLGTKGEQPVYCRILSVK